MKIKITAPLIHILCVIKFTNKDIKKIFFDSFCISEVKNKSFHCLVLETQLQNLHSTVQSKDLVSFTTRVSDTSDTCATQTARVRHEQHESSTNDTSATRVDIFGFHNDTHENILSYPYISYIANESYKLNFAMAKAMSKSYTNAFARSRIVIRSNKTSFLIKPLYVKVTTFFLASTNKN